MQRQRRLSAARPGTLSLKGGDAPPPSAEEEADLASPAYLEKQISQMHLDYLLHKTSCAEFAEADLTSSFRNTDALVARTISDVSSRYELRDDSFTMNHNRTAASKAAVASEASAESSAGSDRKGLDTGSRETHRETRLWRDPHQRAYLSEHPSSESGRKEQPSGQKQHIIAPNNGSVSRIHR
eukprot:gene2201-3390_t